MDINEVIFERNQEQSDCPVGDYFYLTDENIDTLKRNMSLLDSCNYWYSNTFIAPNLDNWRNGIVSDL